MSRGYKLAIDQLEALLAGQRETWEYIAEVHGATPERAAEIVSDVFNLHSSDPPGPESARQIAIEVRHHAIVERDLGS